MTTETDPYREVGSAIRRFLWRWRRATRAAEPALADIEAMTAPAFRVLVAERLRAVERDVAEVRARASTGCCSSWPAP